MNRNNRLRYTEFLIYGPKKRRVIYPPTKLFDARICIYPLWEMPRAVISKACSFRQRSVGVSEKKSHVKHVDASGIKQSEENSPLAPIAISNLGLRPRPNLVGS